MNIYDTIIEMLGEYADCANVTAESRLIADIGIDSLDLMTLVNDAEDKFDVRLTDEELKSIVTVGDVVKLIEGKLK